MKKKLLFSATLILLALTTIKAQQLPLPSSTTEEEYNYATRGYAIQVSSGLDMKKGYKVNTILDKQMGFYDFNFKALVREGRNEICSILVIATSSISNKTYYLCIPQGNDELIKRYWDDLDKWDRPMSVAYGQIVSYLFGAVASAGHEVEKRK